MARNKGTSIFAANFEPTGQAPLDARLVVATQSDLTAAETYIAKNYYKGMTVTVQEDGSIWTLMNPDSITDLNSWVKQTSGQGTSEILVVDNITTDSGTNALSARQGKVLGDKIQEILDSKGEASGFASLGEDGKVPASQLPSFVDDVIEFDSKEGFPEVGESGKIYVDKETNTTWRWGGSEYANVGSSLALGETSETAFAGDKGKELQEKVATIESTISTLPSLKEGLEEELGKKVDWNSDKTAIPLPDNGSIVVGETDSLLIGQRTNNINGEDIVTTEVGSVDSETALNSKSGKIKVRNAEGEEKTVAYEEDLKAEEGRIEHLEEAVGTPGDLEFDVEPTGLYKLIEDSMSWYEEVAIEAWNGVNREIPEYNEEFKTYSISSPEELAWISDNVDLIDKDTTIILTSDIDLGNQQWKPIGDSKGIMNGNPNAKHFKGIFDGRGHTIKNLACSITDDDNSKAGLFGSFQGTLKNLNIDGADIKSNHFAAAFVAYNTGVPCIIENCVARNVTILDTAAVNSEGVMDNGDKAGVIAGYISAGGSKINKCKINGAFVKAYRDLGGIVGYVGSNNIVVEITNNTLKGVNLVQDLTNGYKTVTAVNGHVGTIYGWKDNNTVVESGNVGEANIIVINPEGSN